MGNQVICCAQRASGFDLKFALKNSEPAEAPLTLTEQQKQFVFSHDAFPNQLRKNVTLKVGKDDLFQGELDEKGNPVGFSIFKSEKEESIYFGKFSELAIQGNNLFYVLPDGSYFQGNLMDESAIVGSYMQKDYKYQGQLEHRPGQIMRYIPHGTGKEETTGYIFEGKFQNGKRIQGKLQWIENQFKNEYEGQFDQEELFTGKGVLRQKSGVYTGDFVKGKKEGTGKYEHSVGLIYEGEYRQGNKHGRGKISNHDGTVSYEGEFKDGLPHGNGTSYNTKSLPVSTEFIEGITKQNYLILTEEEKEIINSKKNLTVD